ncbi:beta-eliminating lyase-related protein [Paenibacillus aurantius]|uniref:Beta-eliminating lyase-related protein n=1 Tax=Paenibacillus aurantius TaxID=2918900 RepID=A0AA96LDV8_9BACL|nr:beta-eliminating lyase-related protein [Paenibacillus aurantius]WNQ11423.1 beta-eliminating lyase-related protein [Paenibacillus aurantius]
MTKNGAKSLMEAFRQAPYRLTGHGPRTVGVLKEALQDIDDGRDSDMYGKGEVIEAFQQKMAAVLGKEAAVFFPSGTMAQQIALRVWCDRKGVRKVAYHPLCHLEIHEEDGLKRLHHIEPVLLADSGRLIGLEDVTGLKEDIGCLLLELPQRELGGELPAYETLKAISAYCREKGIPLHLDGARLFEILPYYGKTAAEVSELFDSVYLSFYKGLGGVAGAILAGSRDFMAETVPWKRRYGGDLISLYPYILSADYYYEQRSSCMEQYYREARELAALFNECHPAVSTRPPVPVSNMFHVHLRAPKEKLEAMLAGLYEETGIGMTGWVAEKDGHVSSFEISVGDQYGRIPKEELREAFRKLGLRLSALQQAD